MFSGAQSVLISGGTFNVAAPPPLRVAQEPAEIFHLTPPCAADLCACALLNRTWTLLAQKLIFSTIFIQWNLESSTRLARLVLILEVSPHLVDHVCELHLALPPGINPSDVERLSEFPFPRLHTLSLTCVSTRLSSACLPSMRRLLAKPGVTTVAFTCGFEDPDEYFDVWDGCSMSIRRLHLNFYPEPPPSFTPGSREKRVPIEVMDGLPLIVYYWSDPRCPFDLSTLRAVQLRGRYPRLPTEDLTAAAREKIEIVSVQIYWEHIDLSAFGCIKQLIVAVDAEDVAPTLQTIRSLSDSASKTLQVVRLDVKLRPVTHNPLPLEGLFQAIEEVKGLLSHSGLRVVEVLLPIETPRLLPLDSIDHGAGQQDGRVDIRWNFRPEEPENWSVLIRIPGEVA
ncbi:hypothetical protein FB45DRAFT_1067570 [Roridomyces roridus]|uniref:Uncharacterized protein n=1 Tax=Roridomyces roridus TaxID=1738132 RepID=A0AAD7B270_9AGAR|nr:hypothetical protein FB45DRAFT_1067570 [Roridomyces roridus]